MRLCLGIVLIVIILVTACATTRPAGIQTPSTSRERVRDADYVEDFDPLTLQDDDIVVPPPAVPREPIAESDTNPENDETEQEVTEDRLIQGFRVQLMATSDETQARELRRNAIFKFPQDDVYMTFEGSLYKVRVGDCQTRDEAEALRDLAIRGGFRDAWIVPARVNQK